MKLIFLDHDGVMCLQPQWGSRAKRPNKYDVDYFDKGCVQILNEILIEVPDAEIVVSSDWKYDLSLPMMREMYSWQGVIKQPIGFTGTFNNSVATTLEFNRAQEINEWLNVHNINEPWVAIDDLDMNTWLTNHFVICSKDNEGIKQDGIKNKIIKILNNI